VTISEPFYIGRREITQLEWSRLSGEPTQSPESEQLAATSISYAEAVEVLGRHSLRLPTEAEWEFASHACGTWSHEGALEAFGWHRTNAEGALHVVGTLQPNGLGLYDMLGNVEEWCLDWYSAEEYAGDSQGVKDPMGPPSGLKRVVRGGSWLSRATSCRSTSRGGEAPQFESSTVGVRVVRYAGSRKAVEWAEVLERRPNPKIVTDAILRAEIEESGLPWRVREMKSGIEMLLVPRGSYMRGASETDLDADTDESPSHVVTLTRCFYLGRYEVTQSQWESVMGSNPAGMTRHPDNPVENVSYNDVASFQLKTGTRLPTEAEWERACRAGSTSVRYGDLQDIAWYARNSGARTRSVGLRGANALGFHDMLGNVWEWCSDWYVSDSYSDLGTNVMDPLGQMESGSRSVRGGAWSSLSGSCRASCRSAGQPHVRSPIYGFRAARDP
jgi:formylglycine-generating enzyme required for sulfatase activity